MLNRQAREVALAKGYFVNSMRTSSVRVVGGSGRKMKNLLGPEDASFLYRGLHAAPTLVIASGAVLVSVDPSRNPPNERATRSLGTFLAYKASFALVRGLNDVTAAFERFEEWLGGIHCDGAHDPRILPLHVFDAGRDSYELDTKEGAKRFRKRYGLSKSRTDGSARVWERGVEHGQAAVRVAGCELPAGMHWDVTGPNRFRLFSSSEIWEVNGPGYLNVYPDEHVRGPGASRATQVRRLWPSTKNASR